MNNVHNGVGRHNAIAKPKPHTSDLSEIVGFVRRARDLVSCEPVLMHVALIPRRREGESYPASTGGSSVVHCIVRTNFRQELYIMQ